MILKGKKILLGVSGSIAAYKAATLASSLSQSGAQVTTILTEAATKFITPLTFQSLTGNPAYQDQDLWGSQAHVLHINLAKEADLLIVAPATANTLAKLALGFSDDLLSLAALGASCPLLIALAMDGGMFQHPSVQDNIERLGRRGAVIVGPETGHLASGLSGMGRMSEPEDILGQARLLLSRNGPLKGRSIVVTAGGTQEPVDPVRVLANRSSGKQGFALAEAALDAGADVTLISGPTSLKIPIGAKRISVTTAEEMAEKTLEACQKADALIMAAAVADFRPSAAVQKIKKGDGPPLLALEPTPDILKLVAKQRCQSGYPKVVIGFAAETENLLENAKTKIREKNLDMIAANDVSRPGCGFGCDDNQVTLIRADGATETLVAAPKIEVAQKIIERLRDLLETALPEACLR